MSIKIIQTEKALVELPAIYLIKEFKDLKSYPFTQLELEYIENQLKDKKKTVKINSYSKWSYIQLVDWKGEQYVVKEKLRRAAGDLNSVIKENKHEGIILIDVFNDAEYALAYAEGLALSQYQFLKYFSKANEKKNYLKEIFIYSQGVDKEQIYELNVLLESVSYTKNLVNEPVSFMNTEQFSKEIQTLGKAAGFEVDTFDKKKIEALQMNGLLTVNKGSIDPPNFSVLTWKPDGAVNKKPFILVGKGVVYDTGGLNIKTGNHMDTMKSDMAGAATVAGTIYAVAKANIPVYIIGLIPTTDNRPNGNAYVSDDIIVMNNGISIEVKNTDAEGRLILADALIYAKKYNPELVIDLATLTGSAEKAIGSQGLVAMSNVKDDQFEQLKVSGNNVYERIVEFPLWEEYGEMLKSEIADIKNLAEGDAGAITAAKFLENFVDYPWVHMDIAGCAFLSRRDNYRGVGSTAVGVRLLFDFFNSQL